MCNIDINNNSNINQNNINQNNINQNNNKCYPYNARSANDVINCKKNFKNYYTEENNKTNFSLTCLGTMGFSFTDIYTYLPNNTITNIIISKNNTQLIGTTEYKGYLQSQYIYGHSNESCYYIAVNDYVGNQSQQIFLLSYNSTLSADNILSRIQITHSPFQNNIYNACHNYSIKRMYYGGVNIKKLHIQVLNKYGKIINLQNYPTNFVLEFTIEYSSEKLNIFRNILNSDKELL